MKNFTDLTEQEELSAGKGEFTGVMLFKHWKLVLWM